MTVQKDDRDSLSLVRTIAAFVGWLTGALAGVGAILYSLGYLIFSAHLKFLGVSGILDENGVHFIQEGGVFAADIILQMLRWYALPLLSILGVFAALLVGPGAWLAEGLARLFPALPKTEGRWQRALVRWPIWREVSYLALFLLFLLHANKFLDRFYSPLSISSALFDTQISARTADTKMTGALPLLAGGEPLSNIDKFRLLSLGYALSGLLLFGAWHVTAGWRFRGLLLSWFLLGFLLFSLLLPMDYGVLIYSTQYPVIRLSSEKALTQGLGNKLFLLSKTDQDFVVWDEQEKQLVWFPTNQLNRALIGRVEELLGQASPQPKGAH
jgi:hypothetical protein